MSCEKEAAKPCAAGKTVMSVLYDRNVHTVATHAPLKQSISLEGCSAFGGKGLDLNPIDLLAMGMASCMLIVMGKTAEAENLDIVGAKADVSYDLVNYRIAGIKATFRLPGEPRELPHGLAHRKFRGELVPEADDHRTKAYPSLRLT